MLKKNTIFNDPIYGFITIESDLILQLINHPLEILMYKHEKEYFNINTLNKYLKLEDLDIFYLIKTWRKSSNNVLRKLSKQLINR